MAKFSFMLCLLVLKSTRSPTPAPVQSPAKRAEAYNSLDIKLSENNGSRTVRYKTDNACYERLNYAVRHKQGLYCVLSCKFHYRTENKVYRKYKKYYAYSVVKCRVQNTVVFAVAVLAYLLERLFVLLFAHKL